MTWYFPGIQATPRIASGHTKYEKEQETQITTTKACLSNTTCDYLKR